MADIVIDPRPKASMGERGCGYAKARRPQRSAVSLLSQYTSKSEWLKTKTKTKSEIVGRKWKAPENKEGEVLQMRLLQRLPICGKRAQEADCEYVWGVPKEEVNKMRIDVSASASTSTSTSTSINQPRHCLKHAAAILDYY
jgi:hypothetical protein